MAVPGLAAHQPFCADTCLPAAPDAVPPIFERRTFFVNGQRISALVAPGSGPAVLLLHGNSSCKEVWTAQLPLLLELNRPVIAPDLPGHGESGNAVLPAQTYSFPGYARAISALLDALAVESLDVVGWSLGGHIALELLATDPRVRGALIVGTPPARPSPEALVEAFYPSDEMGLAGKQNFLLEDARRYAAAMIGDKVFLSPHLLRMVIRTDGAARFHMVNNALAGVGVDERAVAETCAKPLCVVHGENEPFVRLDYLQSLAYRSLWEGAVQVVPGAGHAPHLTQAPIFNTILRRFLYCTG